MSDNQLIQTIRRDKAMQKLWDQLSADSKRRLLAIMEGEDMFLLDTLAELVEIEKEEAGK